MARTVMYERYRRFVSVRSRSGVYFRHQTSRHLQVGICPMQEQIAGLYVESNRTILARVGQPRSTVPIVVFVLFGMRIRRTASQRTVEEVRVIHFLSSYQPATLL